MSGKQSAVHTYEIGPVFMNVEIDRPKEYINQLWTNWFKTVADFGATQFGME